MPAEELLKDVMPFLAMNIHWLTMCDNSTQCRIANAWCYECSELRDGHKRSETCEACPECKNLRSIIQLSRHWNEVMWKQRCVQRRWECECRERRRIRLKRERRFRDWFPATLIPQSLIRYDDISFMNISQEPVLGGDAYAAEYMQDNFWRTYGELLTTESQARSRTYRRGQIQLCTAT